MNFDLTDEHQMLQDSLRRFLKYSCNSETRNEVLNSETGITSDLWACDGGDGSDRGVFLLKNRVDLAELELTSH